MPAVPICFRFERQFAERAFSRACAKTGNRIAAKIAMMAITTSNSISVNAAPREPRRVYSFFNCASLLRAGSREAVTGFNEHLCVDRLARRGSEIGTRPRLLGDVLLDGRASTNT